MSPYIRAICAIAMTILLAELVLAQDRLPIIDMHVHSYDDQSYFVAPDGSGRMAPPTADDHFDSTYEIMRRNNIVVGAFSGSFTSEGAWAAKDEDGRLLRGFNSIHSEDLTAEKFERLVKDGDVNILGEIVPSFYGRTLADPYYEPYLRICEEYGVPVALHTGGAPPGINYRGYPNASILAGNPLLVEEVLVRYPKLKVYLMHSGERFYEEALSLMLSYRQVYSGLGAVLWVAPAAKFYSREFLRRAKEFGLLERVMFGSDQMVWPHAIQASIDELQSIDFLTQEEKRDIFYNNAARFLGLPEEQIAEHHRH